MNKLCVFLAIVFLYSCQQKTQFSEFVSIENHWSKNTPITFEFQATDTTSFYDIFINLRNDETYPYSNIFLITKMEYADIQEVVDTLEYEMATPQGEWLGKGFSVKQSKLWYKENVKFSKQGTYKFSIWQADRKLGENNGVENLEGITEVGLQIDVKK